MMMYQAQQVRALMANRGGISLRSTVGNSFFLRRLDPGPDTPKLITLRKSLTIPEAINEMVMASADCALVQEYPDTMEGVVSLKSLLELVGSGRLVKNNRLYQVMDRVVALEPDSATLEELFKRSLHSKATFFVIADRSGSLKGVVPVGEILDFCLRERDSLELSADIEVESHGRLAPLFI